LRTLVILLAVIALMWIVRVLLRRSSLDLKKLGRYAVIGLIGVLFLLLLMTGRLNWMFALAAAALPALYRLLPLIRYVPLLRNLYRRYQARQGVGGAGGAAGGQSSSVQSDYLRMTLNHDSGEMDGEIMQGQFQGQRLQALSLTQLLALLQEVQHDQDSLSLLVAFLDRHHEDWREQADAAHDTHDHDTSPQGTTGKMTKQEACEILGLTENADEKEIIQAHRRLMQKLHPDHGGSTYLAAKINLAKDVLLGKT
jgi:hypothetical protein